MIKDETTQVDCIICDCNMPLINGLQFLQAVRMGRNPKIPRNQPFLLLTGHGEADLVKTAIALDVSGYLVKPVAMDKQVGAIDRALKKPIDLKDPTYYQNVPVPKQIGSLIHTEAPNGEPSAWVVITQEKFRSNPTIQNNISALREEGGSKAPEDVTFVNRRQCDLSEVQQGMVLAEDILAEEGTILVGKGTSISARMIQRLREIAVETGARKSIWIGDIVRNSSSPV